MQSQNIGSDYGYILILPQTLQLCVRKDRQEKQYAEGTGGIILGTGEGDSTDDLQRIGEIYCKLCNTSLEHQRKRLELQEDTDAALRTVTGAHKMASIDHLHQASLTLKVKYHSDMLSAQYLVNCLEEDHVCHGITTQKPRPRPMKETPLQTYLNCSSKTRRKQEGKPPESAHTRGRFGY